MKSLPVWTLAILASLITLGSGWLHGHITQRWGQSDAMMQAALRLDSLPAQVGPWVFDASYELSDEAVAMLSCQGYIYRGYRNEVTGDSIKLAVMVGPGAKMSVHVPEVCYESNNYTLLEDREIFNVEVNGQTHHFWSVHFRVNEVSQRELRVLYGWTNGGHWQAPRVARWYVAGEPVLYKLQVSHALTGLVHVDEQASQEATRLFMQMVIPLIQAKLESGASE
ncbi:MAG: hypothetical protein CMJ80_03160 [Planctomycetaceae bacterium]|nr:hypothetical protein [Planctomycetaceae bacterium]